jgi:hypothetical protein
LTRPPSARKTRMQHRSHGESLWDHFQSLISFADTARLEPMALRASSAPT